MVALLFALGCAEATFEEPVLQIAVPAPTTTVGPATGGIEGRVFWRGEIPEPLHCDGRPGPLQVDDGGLAGVVIWLDMDGAPPSFWDRAQLRVDDCGLDARVQIVRADASLVLEAWDLGASRRFEIDGYALTLNPEGRVTLPSLDPGPRLLSGDIAGAIVLADHGGYTLSDAQGHFELPEIPPGRHRVHFWHETAGEMHFEITVEVDKRSQIELNWP